MLKPSMKKGSVRLPVFAAAFHYSIPVLLGYLAIGVAFGLLLADAGYPWWLAPLMGVLMYAGAGQYIAVGLFAAGTTLWEAALIQLVVNARHMAYGITMLKRFRGTGPFRYYLIYALTDETFALLSSLPEEPDRRDPGSPPAGDGGRPEGRPSGRAERSRFMFYVALLDHGYWVAGSLAGALAGSFLPFPLEGIGFSLTALFVVLMLEQIFRVRRPGVFIVSALAGVLAVFLLPARVSLLSAMILSLGAARFFVGAGKGRAA
jgi:predicted branched-subunit amino acid permease